MWIIILMSTSRMHIEKPGKFCFSNSFIPSLSLNWHAAVIFLVLLITLANFESLL